MKTNTLVILLSLAAIPSSAEVISWTNTSSSWWSIGSNWSPNQVPSTNDIAVITNAGTYTVTLNLYPTVAGLVLGGESGTQTLSTAEQILTVTGTGRIAPRGVLNLALGALAGPGSLSVEGVLNWSGGAIASNAVVTVAPGGLVQIASGANYGKTLYGTLTNAGTITWQKYGGLAIGGVVCNAGLFDAQADLAISLVGGGLIINDGVFRKSTGTGTIDCRVPLVNNGTVDTQTGTLVLASGSVFNAGCDFIGAGKTVVDSGTNTICGNIHSDNLSLLYGTTLAGTGTVSGTLTWSGGNIGPDAAVTIAAESTLLIASSANFGKYLYGNLTNAGTITWQRYGGLAVGGVLRNAGLFDAQADLAISLVSGGRIINDGVFRKSAGTGATDCQVPLVNNGTVDTQTGRIALASGSVFNSGCSFIGAGTTVMDTGTNTISGNIHSDNLAVLYNATLAGTGTVSGTLTWSGGSIGPDAALTIATDGTLLISSPANFTKNLYGNLTNAGTITWQPHAGLLVGGVLHNLPGALFDGQFDGPIYQGGSGVILNEGVFRKSAGTGATDCQVPLVNHGTVAVSSGTMQFQDSYTNPAGAISLAGGTFKMAQSPVRPLWLSGGMITGWGTVWAEVTNAALIRPAASNGVLTIKGTYSQALNGTLEFELGGDAPGTNQSRLNILGAARLRGSLGIRWGDGYLPSPGINFPVLAFTSRKGEFCCYDNTLLLGQGLRLTPLYSATNLTLAAVAAPDPAVVPLRVAVADGALVCWPVEFTGYELYWSTNLSQTNWTLLPDATNRFLEAPPLPREKFFRLQKP